MLIHSRMETHSEFMLELCRGLESQFGQKAEGVSASEFRGSDLLGTILPAGRDQALEFLEPVLHEDHFGDGRWLPLFRLDH